MAEANFPASVDTSKSNSSDEDFLELSDPRTVRNSFRKSMVARRERKLSYDQCLQLLRTRCKKDDFLVPDVTPRNQSSFFQAISDQMLSCGLTPLNANDLRLGLVSDMQRNPVKKISGGVVDLRTFVSGNWSEYLDHMKNPNTFADEVAVVAMVHYLKKSIFVYASLCTHFMVRAESSAPTNMTVGHVGDLHFQSLQYSPIDSSIPSFPSRPVPACMGVQAPIPGGSPTSEDRTSNFSASVDASQSSTSDEGLLIISNPGHVRDIFRKAMRARTERKLSYDQCLQLLTHRCTKDDVLVPGATPRNASSFFHAISDYMVPCELTQRNAYDLRLGLVYDMQTNPVKKIVDDVVDLRTFVSGNWSEYLDHMKNPNTFADEVAVVAMAHYLKRNIFVFAPLRKHFIVNCNSSSSKIMIVGHVCDLHFQSLEDPLGKSYSSIPSVLSEYPGSSDRHSQLKNHPAVLSGFVKREKIPKNVVRGGKYADWQVDLYQNAAARTEDFDPDRSFEEPGIPFQVGHHPDAELLNMDRQICMARENIEDKKKQIVDRTRYSIEGARSDIDMLLDDIKSLEDHIAVFKDKKMQIFADRYYNAIAPERRFQTEAVIEREQQKPLPLRLPKFQSNTLRGVLREHVIKTATEGRVLSEQVQCPNYYNKHDWIACGVVDFLTQIEIIRDIVGKNCSAQSCSEFVQISEYLNRMGSMLDDDRIFPLLKLEAYPDRIIWSFKTMFSYLCEVYTHFYKCHLPTIGPSRLDVTHVGLHLYAFARSFDLVDDRLLDGMIAAFI